MRAIKRARKFIEQNPQDPAAKVFSHLVLALESESPYNITELYALSHEHFSLAIEILEDWRLDRFYEGKAKLLDVSMQLKELHNS